MTELVEFSVGLVLTIYISTGATKQFLAKIKSQRKFPVTLDVQTLRLLASFLFFNQVG
jgi:hypothetical protein